MESDDLSGKGPEILGCLSRSTSLKVRGRLCAPAVNHDSDDVALWRIVELRLEANDEGNAGGIEVKAAIRSRYAAARLS